MHLGEPLLLGLGPHLELAPRVRLALDRTLERTLDAVDLALDDGAREVEHLERRLEVVLAVCAARRAAVLALALVAVPLSLVLLLGIAVGSLVLVVVLCVAAKVELGVGRARRGAGGGRARRGRRRAGGAGGARGSGDVCRARAHSREGSACGETAERRVSRGVRAPSFGAAPPRASPWAMALPMRALP